MTNTNEVIMKSKLSSSIIDTANLRKTATEVGKRVLVFTVYGYATGIKMVKDRLRDEYYHALTGTFEATYAKDGTRLQTGVLYLPTGIHDNVESAVKTLDSDGGQVAFALEMYVEKADNPQGYSWAAKSLIKPTESDPLEGMREKLVSGGAMKQIEAPKPEYKKK